MRAAVAISILGAVAVLGCAGRTPQVPSGLTLVERERPPLPESLIEEAQARLRTRGLYQGFIDGDLNAETRIALVRLQREAGIPPSGRLDWATATILGLELPGPRPPIPLPAPHPTGERPLPDAAELLAQGEGPPLPQPPLDALAGPRATAAKLLASASQRSGEELGRAEGLLGSETELPQGERVVRDSQARLASARAEAFRLMVEARRGGGWALLPASMIDRLEQELARRSLLLAKPNGRIDPDDVAAIRWLERSLGMELTGAPSLQLFDALGIDVAPIFEE